MEKITSLEFIDKETFPNGQVPLKLRLYAEANRLEERNLRVTDKISDLKEEAEKSSNELRINIEGIKIIMIEASRNRME